MSASRVAWLGLLGALGVGAPARAADVEAGPGDYLDAIAGLGPGDTLRLSPGEYTGCLHLFGVHGAPGQPITITGPDAGARPVFRGGPCAQPSNPRDSVIVFLQDASYITVRNLELDGEGQLVNGVRGGFGTTPVHDITLEGLYIHDNDVNNQPSGVSSFATAWNWTIRGCRIERTGLGMYLGDSDGTDPFIGGTIEHNLILNPRGYGMQIKHQLPREDVAGMPQGDRVTYIRHNVFIKQANAATGDDARPNLLVGAFPPSGVGANDRYEIYGNLFFENQSGTEPLFQGEGYVLFHDNVLVNSYGGSGVLIRPHNGLVRITEVFRNTVLTEGIGISITGAQLSQRVEGNVVFANGMPAIMGGTATENVQGTLLDAADALVDPTPMLGQLDAYPSAEGTIRGAALDWSAYTDAADIGEDFNGDPRDGTWRGAYAGAGTNPGWRLAAEIKPPTGAPPPDDAGVSGEDAAAPEDGGPAPTDGGAVETPDATAGADAGQPAPGVDAGEEVRPEGVAGGCRCAHSAGASGAGLGVLFVLGFLRRRRG